MLGDILVECYVERQGAVDDDVAQLSAVAHFGQQGAFGRRNDAGKQLLGGGDAGDLRSFDTQQAGNVGQVSDLLDLLFEIGQRDDRDVGDDEQLVVAGHLDDRHVAQHALRGEQSGFLIEDAAHVFVGRDQSLHQHVGVACHDGGHGLLHAFHVAGLVDDVECLDVDVVFGAYLLDDFLLTEQRGLHDTFLVGFVDGFQRMRILAVGYGQPFFTPFSRLVDDFCKMLDHCGVLLLFILPDCTCRWR